MEEQLISFKTAKLAKEKGLIEDCNFNTLFYNTDGELTGDDTNDYPAITQSLLQRQLREVHKLMITFGTYRNKFKAFIYYLDRDYYKNEDSPEFDSELYNTYEEALEIGLFEALKLIK